MFMKGDLVKYVQPHETEIGSVFKIGDTVIDNEGAWVLLEVSEDSNQGEEISPGVTSAGWSVWRRAECFVLVSSKKNSIKNKKGKGTMSSAHTAIAYYQYNGIDNPA